MNLHAGVSSNQNPVDSRTSEVDRGHAHPLPCVGSFRGFTSQGFMPSGDCVLWQGHAAVLRSAGRPSFS